MAIFHVENDDENPVDSLQDHAQTWALVDIR
jgi:hypothetical protein